MEPHSVEMSRPHLMIQAAPVTTVDVEARTVEVTFSTGDLVAHAVRVGADMRRMPTRVVISEAAVDLDFLRASGPVLDSHMGSSARAVIGSVEDAWIAEGACRARLRFAQIEDVEPLWQRIAQGHLRNVSAGFEVMEQELRYERDERGRDAEVMYFTRWRPVEISVVSVPADKGSRIQSAGKPVSHQDTGLEAGNEAAGEHATPEATQPQAAAAAITSEEETHMAEHQQQGAAPHAAQVPASPPVHDAIPDASAIRQAERERITQIEHVGRTLGLDDATIRQARESDTSVDEFRVQAIDSFAQRGHSHTQGIGGARATVTADGRDRFRQGALEGQMARMGLGGERNEFSGLTLSELARQALEVSNIRAPGNRMEMVGIAFQQSSAGAHTTSDFANVLANLMGKGALKGWEEAEETYQLWTSTGVLTDFKPTKRVGLGLVDALPAIAEGASYTYGTVGDRGETITLATYGKMIKITRQAIINDDLALFSSVPAKMGRAARRTIGNLCYAVLTGNPTMSDGTALFHADHRNLASSGAAPSVTSLSAGRAAMRTQVETTGGAALNIAPARLIVPAALETVAQQLMTSIVDPTAQKGHASNPVAGMAQVVTDGRLDAASATAWFLAADPAMHDTVEVAFLDGIQEPYIEEQTAWSMDGVEVKVRIDAGVAPLDFRGLYKDPGA